MSDWFWKWAKPKPQTTPQATTFNYVEVFKYLFGSDRLEQIGLPGYRVIHRFGSFQPPIRLLSPTGCTVAVEWSPEALQGSRYEFELALRDIDRQLREVASQQWKYEGWLG